MKIEEVEGIVLSETNYSESSKILNILTKQYGLIGVMSRGSGNMKSKLRGVSRKLVYGTFYIYYKQNGISTLISVDVINSFNGILKDLTKISYSSYIIDLVLQVVKQNDDRSIYGLLKQVLLKIEDGLSPEVLTDIIELKVLNYLGVAPMIDGCSICGSTKEIITVSSISGGYVCRNCYTDQGIVSEKTIKLLRMLYYVEISSISKLDISKETLKEINFFISDYYDRYTGIYLKSKNFLKKIMQLEA